jgi:CheY-like chemotaxis protein
MPPQKRSCAILAAEDEELDLILLKRAFKDINAALPVYSVTDGGEVISYLSGTGAYNDRNVFPLPDLILLDLKLPRKSGFEIIAWLKEHSLYRKIPVVVLTSSRLGQDVQRAYELGASGYFVKHTDPARYVEQIRVIHRYWCESAERPAFMPSSF